MNDYYAAVDIGSNSVRLLLIRAFPRPPAQRGIGDRFDLPALEKVMTMRFVTRLGETPGTLSRSGVEKTINAIKEFLTALKPYDAPLFVFATSAVREANNKEMLFWPLKALGIKADVLSGEREAALSCAVLPQTGGCIDIGGGSTEILARKDGVSVCQSFPVGAVRAKALFDTGVPSLGRQFERWLSEAFAGLNVRLEEPVLGAGGTITTLAAYILGTDHQNPKDLAFTRAHLDSAVKALAAATPRQLQQNPLFADRADIILYGAGILAFVMDALGVSNIIATKKDNLYAYLLDVLQKRR